MTYRPTAKSYFSGAGGMDLGMIQAGVKVVQSLELDHSCAETLRANFDHEVIEADIAEERITAATAQLRLDL